MTARREPNAGSAAVGGGRHPGAAGRGQVSGEAAPGAGTHSAAVRLTRDEVGAWPDRGPGASAWPAGPCGRGFFWVTRVPARVAVGG